MRGGSVSGQAGEIEVALDTPRGAVFAPCRPACRRRRGARTASGHRQANAAGLRGAGEGVLQRSGCKARVCGRADHENHASCEGALIDKEQVMALNEVVLCGAVRTSIGTYGGALRGTRQRTRGGGDRETLLRNGLTGSQCSRS